MRSFTMFITTCIATIVTMASAAPQTNVGQVVPNLTPTAPAIVPESCLQCICFASTECKHVGCNVAGPEQYFCGPYLISWAYWADAGKIGSGGSNPFGFEACLNNDACAASTVQGYMNKYTRDCDGDGVVTCNDYARIHKAGPHACNATFVTQTPYWQAYSQCAIGQTIDIRIGGK